MTYHFKVDFFLIEFLDCQTLESQTQGLKKPLRLKGEVQWCNILTFAPAQKCYSKVIHRKEVTHSNGQ